jgi:hypothetical protein
MDSSISAKDEIWFLRVCHHVSNALYQFRTSTTAQLCFCCRLIGAANELL